MTTGADVVIATMRTTSHERKKDNTEEVSGTAMFCSDNEEKSFKLTSKKEHKQTSKPRNKEGR
jgi:hypothetical protein